MMNKTDLRRHHRAARAAFVAGLASGERVRLERALAAQVLPVLQPLLARGAMVGSHAAIGSEIDPVWIEKAIGPHAFPRVTGPDLVFHQAEWAEMAPGFQSIPEPPLTAPVVQPDVLLVPLLAVTLAGVRLGQGRGYYDRAIAGLRPHKPVLAIGIAWECQIAATLPADRWDMAMDMVATPQRLVDCRKAR